MKALVVYESYFGNTERVASAIGEGLGELHAVELAEVGEAAYEALKDVDLLVVGGPTLVFAMSRESTRIAARDEVKKQAPDREPVSMGIGVREWLDDLPDGQDKSAAAFDTRISRKRFPLPGAAAKGIESRLKRRGYEFVGRPTGFIVRESAGPLEDGEIERAREWGRELATEMGEATAA